mgnify:CR=1 FL=1
MIEPDRAAMTREDRDELASLAQAAARRNRPTHLVAAAVVLLVGALAMAGSALLSRQSAERALARAASENVRARALIDEIKRITNERQGGSGTVSRENDPVPNFGSTMSNLASQAGLSVGIPQEQSQASGAYIRRNYTYNLSTPNLDAVMTWVQRTAQEIPGTQVTGLTVTPQAANRIWTVSIKFARLERSQARAANP